MATVVDTHVPAARSAWRGVAGFLAIALAAFLGPSLGNAMIAIGITATPIFVRLARGQVLAARGEDWVEAARAVGNPPVRILLRHILPNILPPVMVQATLAIAAAIIAEASLSFLGLGQQPPSPSWGSMLNAAQRYLPTAPWIAMWPGIMIFTVVFSLNILGDGLRDLVALAVRFLDDVVEVNEFPVPEITAAVRGNRKIGLGVMGWADLLIAAGIPYASDEALALAERVAGTIAEVADATSEALAREKRARAETMAIRTGDEDDMTNPISLSTREGGRPGRFIGLRARCLANTPSSMNLALRTADRSFARLSRRFAITDLM